MPYVNGFELLDKMPNKISRSYLPRPIMSTPSRLSGSSFRLPFKAHRYWRINRSSEQVSSVFWWSQTAIWIAEEYHAQHTGAFFRRVQAGASLPKMGFIFFTPTDRTLRINRQLHTILYNCKQNLPDLKNTWGNMMLYLPHQFIRTHKSHLVNKVHFHLSITTGLPF